MVQLIESTLIDFHTCHNKPTKTNEASHQSGNIAATQLCRLALSPAKALARMSVSRLAQLHVFRHGPKTFPLQTVEAAHAPTDVWRKMRHLKVEMDKRYGVSRSSSCCHSIGPSSDRHLQSPTISISNKFDIQLTRAIRTQKFAPRCRTQYQNSISPQERSLQITVPPTL